jgi:hypothetical protein
MMTSNYLNILPIYAGTGQNVAQRGSQDQTQGEKNGLAEWVNYIKKKKDCGKLPNPRVEALDGIKFEWTSDREPKKTFEEWFAELEEYKNTFNTVLFIGSERKIYKTLADWTSYTKLTAIKVLENKGKNSEFTLIRIKKLVDIGVVPRSNYLYRLDSAEDVDDGRTSSIPCILPSPHWNFQSIQPSPHWH